MGEAGWLPTWDDVVEYFQILEEHSGRVAVEVAGRSTDGRPYLVVAVSAEQNLVPEVRTANRDALSMLWDSRGLDDDTVEDASNTARVVGVILAAQHSNEIGSMLMSMHLAWELATATDPDSLQILSEAITILIPSHNPDGVDLIADWYRESLGTPWEGSEIPWLYHPYVGHDNNRDWFMQSQIETRLYVEMHNREHPQAVFDMHQMRRFGPRFMVPPFIDPLDPNQDPVIQQGFAALGSHIAQRMTAAGKAGVVTNAMFDNYSPSLAYGNYHGSVDLLSEAASVRLATPVTLEERDLKVEDGADPRVRSWNQPLVWEPGEWSLADIVDYNLVAARAFLEHLARNRRQWLSDYAALNKRTGTRTKGPYAFVIPQGGRDPQATAELLDILQRGLVEIHAATGEFVADGVRYPAGTWVVKLDQPAGAFSKTLLEVQHYPEIRKSENGPLLPPYDISGHTLPIQMGVDAFQVDTPLAADAPLEVVREPIRFEGAIVQPERDGDTWVIDGRSNAVVPAISRLLRDEVPVYRVRVSDSLRNVLAGDVVISRTDLSSEDIQSLVAETGCTARSLDALEGLDVKRQTAVRIGVYQSWTACIDEGWARWVLDQYGVPFESLRNDDIRQGDLGERIDVLVLPEMSADEILNGKGEKTRDGDPVAETYQGGLGAVGVAALKSFVSEGGRLVAVDRAAQFVIDALALPVEDALEGSDGEEFNCPGSLLEVVMDREHPLGWGLPRELGVLFMNSAVFRATGPETTVVGRYPTTNPLLSGWISGDKRIRGQGALVEVQHGEGSVVLFGFRPWFRAQARGTYRTFFNALFQPALEDAEWPGDRQ
jgi:choline dehydrogenase-like flavoprotein